MLEFFHFDRRNYPTVPVREGYRGRFVSFAMVWQKSAAPR